MNPPVKTLLCALLLLGGDARAEFIRADGTWQVKPGTTCDVIPPERRDIVLLAMNAASREAEHGNKGAAISEWAAVGEANKGAEAEAVSMVERAKLFAGRGQFEDATELIDDLFARHSAYPGFQSAVQVQFEIANRLADGERRYLGGWMPWFRDREKAVSLWQKTIRLAPNGPLADECLIRSARLAQERGLTAQLNENLERIVSDYPKSKYAPEALEMLAGLRGKESMGPDWDQATTLEAADHWRTLADQHPNDPRTKQAAEQIAMLRDRAARARLQLARFYWFSRNNPEAAKLMANACRNISPESAAAKEAEIMLAEIQKNPDPPKTIADRLLGTYPRPRMAADIKPGVVGDELDSLGFKKEAPKSATDNERR
jgi:outer membrane protein assembly factor BamD